MPLQRLDVSRCDKITDAGLQFLTGMPLQHLNASDCSITDACLQHLASMQLQHLNLVGCHDISYAGLENFPNLARIARF